MAFTCGHCKSTEFNTHLREVTATVGWKASEMKTIAPCTMCSRCGNLTVPVDVKIGKFMNLVPGANPPPPGTRVDGGEPAQPADETESKASVHAIHPAKTAAE